MISREQLLLIMPDANAVIGDYVDVINDVTIAFGITSKSQQAMFIAQIAHESCQLQHIEENLNYSANGLARTWPDRFALRRLDGSISRDTYGQVKPNHLAMSLHRQPEKIANNVYANRLGNGNEQSGDGWLFRGAGLIQLTGRDNHSKAAQYFKLRVEDIGEWLRTPIGASQSAGWYWKSRGCNAIAETGDFECVTKAINGGLIGIRDRCDYWEKAKRVL